MRESESEVTQSCLTLSDPMDCNPPGSSVHGIFQARVLEWVANSFSSNLYNESSKGNEISCISESEDRSKRVEEKQDVNRCLTDSLPNCSVSHRTTCLDKEQNLLTGLVVVFAAIWYCGQFSFSAKLPSENNPPVFLLPRCFLTFLVWFSSHWLLSV